MARSLAAAANGTCSEKPNDCASEAHSPAAAPLGTDDEAAGTPATPDQIRLAAATETEQRAASVAQEVGSEARARPRQYRMGLGLTVWVLAVLLIAVVMALGVATHFFGLLPA